MHLLALGAFWPGPLGSRITLVSLSLNAPFGARCFLAGAARFAYNAGLAQS